jgi:hypothetical protein
MDEVLAAYSAHHSETIQLRPAFHILRPYKLVTDAEARLFQTSRIGDKRVSNPTPTPALTRLFAQASDIIRLGPVFFNHQRTLAIVSVSNWCGGLCGGQAWRIFIKRDHVWIEQSWSRCTLVS